MTQQIINTGVVPNDGTGTPLRSGGTIINANFTDLYTALVTANAAIAAVTTTANTAVTSANTANATAGSALSTASSASATAGTANTNASSALSGLTSTNAVVAGHTLSIAGFNQLLRPLFPSGDTSGATDFANLAAAIAIMVADTTGSAHILTLTTGIYYVNAKSVFLFNILGEGNLAIPYEFRGQGGVRIIQVTANTGILEFQVPTNGFPSNVKVSAIQFEAQSQQTSSNTGSFGIGWRSVNSTATGTETTWGYVIEFCRFVNVYRGVANTQPAGIFPVWGVVVKDCNFHSLSGAAVRIVSPVSVGQPNISFWNCLVDTPYLGGSEAMYQISACDNASMINLENLKVINVPLIFLNSVSNFRIIACKGEACEYDNVSSGSNPAISLQNSNGSVDFRLNGVTVGSGAVPSSLVSVQNGAAGQSVIIESISVGLAAGTGTLVLFQGNLINIIVEGTPNIIGLGTGPGVVNFMSTAGGVNTAKVLQFLSYPGGTISDDQGDASVTWSGQTSAGTLIFNTPLTANRTVTLPTTLNTVGTNNLWNGVTVTVIRTANATGASTLTVNGSIPSSKAVAIGARVQFQWRLSLGWVQTDSATL
jgi:hypothetical protein